MKFPCPNCEQNLEIGDDLVGTSFPCPSCGKSIHIEVQEETDSSVDDYTDFSCVHCDGIIRTSKSMEGSEINCPHCDEITFLQSNEEIEEEYDPYHKKHSSEAPLGEDLKSNKKQKRVVPEHAFGHRQIIGLVGCLILFLGVFAPIAKVPLFGSVNYFMNGKGDGTFVFFFAAIALFAILVKRESLQLVMGLLSLIVLSFSLGRFLSIAETNRYIQLEFGWALLTIGSGLLITPTFMKAKPNNGGEEFFVLTKPWRISSVVIGSICGLLVLGSIMFGVLDFAAPKFAEDTTNQKIATKTEKKKGWEYSSDISPIDDSTTHMLRLEANEKTESGIFGSTPTLIIRHKEGETQVYVSFGTYLGFSTDAITVTLRLDETLTTAEWGLSTDSKAIFYPSNHRTFIFEMLRSKKMVIRVNPPGSNPITSVFELTGLDEAIKPMKPALGLVI
jgi:type VI secretion system protein VasI